jgi:CRP/FNR family transcriptional regulator, polysaccharide utilization system transcription regulator
MNSLNVSPPTLFSFRELFENEADVLHFRKGQIIYSSGSTPLGIYFINTGKAKLCKRGIDGKDQIIRIAITDEILSSSELISGSRYISSATAMDDCFIFFMPKPQFLALLKDHKQFCEYFIKFVSDELMLAESRIADLAYKPVRERLADTLVYLNKKFNGINNKTMSFNISRSDLASYVGTAKETINRFISEFRNDRLITTAGTNIDIVNARGLSMIGNNHF